MGGALFAFALAVFKRSAHEGQVVQRERAGSRVFAPPPDGQIVSRSNRGRLQALGERDVGLEGPQLRRPAEALVQFRMQLTNLLQSRPNLQMDHFRARKDLYSSNRYLEGAGLAEDPLNFPGNSRRGAA